MWFLSEVIIANMFELSHQKSAAKTLVNKVRLNTPIRKYICVFLTYSVITGLWNIFEFAFYSNLFFNIFLCKLGD